MKNQKRLRSCLFALAALFPATTLASLAADEDEFFQPGARIGGYGELHLNYEKPEKTNAEPATLDFHRFVLFAGYDWTPEWSFRSEVEIEHNFVGEAQGELKLEQAYLNWQAHEFLNLQVGVLLVPAGIYNPVHEPPTFNSVERPDYQKSILPTTWYGNGIGLSGYIAGKVEYRAVVMEGLADEKISSQGIRQSRQNGYKSSLETVLTGSRFDYIAIPGLAAGFSIFRNQLMDGGAGSKQFDAVNIAEVHARYHKNGIELSTEFANIDYEILASSTADVRASTGWYAETAYDLARLWQGKSRLKIFGRYSGINTARKTASGGNSEKEYAYTKWLSGITFLPIPEISIKADIGQKMPERGESSLLFNAGAGFMF